MLAENHRADLRGREFDRVGDERAKARGIEHRAEADHLRLRQAGVFPGEIGEDVDRVRHDEDDRVLLDARALEARDDAAEKRDVAVDQIEPRFVRLPAQAGGDADDVGIRAVCVIAGANHLVRAKGRAVQEVERLAFRRRLIGVEDEDFADDAAALQGEGRT